MNIYNDPWGIQTCKLIIKKLQLRSAARRWVRAEGVKAAALAMYKLNRTAKNSYHQVYTYHLKDRFIHYLYANGYCVAAGKSRQEIPCNRCGGSGEYWTGEECRACWGSGVYASHNLYRFVFVIGGRRYVWHQPVSATSFEVTLTTDKIGWYGEKKMVYDESINTDLAALYFFTVREFLADKPGYRDGLIDLGPSIKNLGRILVSKWRRSMRYLGVAFTEKLRTAVRRFLQLPDPGEEPPF